MNSKPDPLIMLVEAMAVGTDAMITRQEAQGQRDLVNSAVLPRDGIEQAAQMGVEVGEPVDDLFVSVVLPAGWRKVATSHSMWSDLLDDQGRKRAAIFYKAAFYDRSAHMSVCRAINVTRRYSDDDQVSMAVVRGDVVLFETESIDRSVMGKDYFDLINTHEQAATAWADTHYPNWRDVGAYWEESS